MYFSSDLGMAQPSTAFIADDHWGAALDKDDIDIAAIGLAAVFATIADDFIIILSPPSAGAAHLFLITPLYPIGYYGLYPA